MDLEKEKQLKNQILDSLLEHELKQIKEFVSKKNLKLYNLTFYNFFRVIAIVKMDKYTQDNFIEYISILGLDRYINTYLVRYGELHGDN